MPTNNNPANPYAIALSGSASIYGELNSMYQNGVNSINPYASPTTFDAYGDPSYNQGNLVQQVGIRAKGAQGEDYLSNIGTGALAGMEVAGPWGAVIGGAIGGISTAITGGAKKREMQRRHNLAISNLNAANKLYGTAKTQYFEHQLGMGDYNAKTNNYDRLNNLYMAQSGQQQ